jgi:hypothetical protein
MMFYPHVAWQAASKFSDRDTHPVSESFARRIASAYRFACKEFGGHGTSGWGYMQLKNSDLYELLMACDTGALSERLSHPASTDLFYRDQRR